MRLKKYASDAGQWCAEFEAFEDVNGYMEMTHIEALTDLNMHITGPVAYDEIRVRDANGNKL